MFSHLGDMSLHTDDDRFSLMTLTNHPAMVCGTGTGIADCSDQTLYHNHSPYCPKNQRFLCDTALSCPGATLLPHGSLTGFDVSVHDNAGDLCYESVVALRLVVCIYNIGCFFLRWQHPATDMLLSAEGSCVEYHIHPLVLFQAT